MKKQFILFLLMMLAIACAAWAETPESLPPAAACFEGPGYATPEEAVLAYIDAMNKGNVDEMLATFAIESFVEHYDPELYLQHCKSLNLSSLYSTSNGFPYKDTFEISLGASARYACIAGRLVSFYKENGAGENSSLMIQNTEELNALVEQFRQSPLYEMAGHVEFIQWINPVSLTDGTIVKPGTGGNMMASIAYTGADDYTELAALLQINGKPACQAMSCVKYGDRWYNLDFGGCIANFYGGRSALDNTLWIPSDDQESDSLMSALNKDYPEETARWNALQHSDRAGTRWPMTTLNVQGITVHDTASETINDIGEAVWAEMHFTRFGGAMITVQVSPLLKERFGMDPATFRICFSWFSDEIPTGYDRVKGEKTITIPTFRFFGDLEKKPFDLTGLTVSCTDTRITITLANGMQAVFEKPNVVADNLIATEHETATVRLENDGYDTPEDAVMAYLDALNRGDVRDMLSTFAVETHTENVDLMYYIGRLGLYTSKLPYFPLVDDYGRSLYSHDRYASLSYDLLNCWASYVTDSFVSDSNPNSVRLKTQEEIQTFLAAFNESPLTGFTGNISFTRWINPVLFSRGTVSMIARYSTQDIIITGADDFSILIAQYQINGKTAYLPMRCVRYGNRWYNDSVSNLVLWMLGFNAENTRRTYIWIPTPDEQAVIEQALTEENTREAETWGSILESDMRGTHWILVGMDNPDITVWDTAEEAENDSGRGIYAEMCFTGTGGGASTIVCSPAMQTILETDTGKNYALFNWQPDISDGSGITVSNVIVNREKNDQNPEDIHASRDGNYLTLALPDGTQVVFQNAD